VHARWPCHWGLNGLVSVYLLELGAAYAMTPVVCTQAVSVMRGLYLKSLVMLVQVLLLALSRRYGADPAFVIASGLQGLATLTIDDVDQRESEDNRWCVNKTTCLCVDSQVRLPVVHEPDVSKGIAVFVHVLRAIGMLVVLTAPWFVVTLLLYIMCCDSSSSQL